MPGTLEHSTRALARQRIVAVASMLALAACGHEESIDRTTNFRGLGGQETSHIAAPQGQQAAATVDGSDAEQTETLALEAATYTQYIALGDSFSSGFGLLTSTSWAGCARDAIYAWPALLHRKLGIGTALNFGACSGASTQDILALGPNVRKKDSPPDWKYQDRPQIEELPPPQQLDTALITIQVGGNDIKYDSSFAACMDAVNRLRMKADPSTPPLDCKAAIASLPTECNGFNWLIDNFSEVVDGNLAPSLDFTFKSLRNAAPNATIIAVGYPHLVDATSACVGLEDCFDAATRQRINLIADAINTQIASAAANAGILSLTTEVVDEYRGHEACSPDEWISSLTGHPNYAGHEAYARVVERGVPIDGPAAPAPQEPAPAEAPAPQDSAPEEAPAPQDSAPEEAPAPQDWSPEEAPAPQEPEPEDASPPWPGEEEQQQSESE